MFDYKEKNFLFHWGVFEEMPEIKMHLHSGYEIFWFIDGDAVYSVEGNIYEIKPGDILITNPRELHAPLVMRKNRYERLFVEVRPSFLSEFFTDDFSPFSVFDNKKAGVGNLVDADFAKEKGLHDMMMKIYEYTKNKRPESRAMIKAYLIQLLVTVAEIKEKGKKDFVKSTKITEIIKYINDNIENDLSLSALEKKFYINKYYLSHLFKAQTGFTVQEYVNGKRILKSKALILEGVSVSEIPTLVGYDDYSTFYRNFKKIAGSSPAKFAK